MDSVLETKLQSTWDSFQHFFEFFFGTLASLGLDFEAHIGRRGGVLDGNNESASRCEPHNNLASLFSLHTFERAVREVFSVCRKV